MSDMKRLKETEYMYAAARVRALENRLVGRERIDALIEARSADEVLSRLSAKEYNSVYPYPGSDLPWLWHHPVPVLC